jgi:hypothetical protein
MILQVILDTEDESKQLQEDGKHQTTGEEKTNRE